MGYIGQQFERLDQSARFKIKIQGDLGETHWISVSPDVVRSIADVLEAAEVTVPDSTASHWHVGSNVPGDSPKADVRCFGDDADAAREALLEELRVAQDALPECGNSGKEGCAACMGHATIQGVLDRPEQVDLDSHGDENTGYCVDVNVGQVLPVRYWITRVARGDCDIESEYV